MASKLSVAHHALDVERFQAYDPVFLDQPRRELVQEIPALVRDTGMQAGHAALLLSPVRRTLGTANRCYLPRELALFMLEAAQVSFKELRVADLLAIGCYGEVCEAKINPDRLGFRREGLFLNFTEPVRGLLLL